MDAVCNASPLITLAKAGLVDIPSFPEAVRRLQAAGLYCDQRTIDMVSRER